MVRAKVVTVMRWCVQDEVNQEESEQDEVEGTKKVGMQWCNERYNIPWHVQSLVPVHVIQRPPRVQRSTAQGLQYLCWACTAWAPHRAWVVDHLPGPSSWRTTCPLEPASVLWHPYMTQYDNLSVISNTAVKSDEQICYFSYFHSKTNAAIILSKSSLIGCC